MLTPRDDAQDPVSLVHLPTYPAALCEIAWRKLDKKIIVAFGVAGAAAGFVGSLLLKPAFLASWFAVPPVVASLGLLGAAYRVSCDVGSLFGKEFDNPSPSYFDLVAYIIAARISDYFDRLKARCDAEIKVIQKLKRSDADSEVCAMLTELGDRRTAIIQEEEVMSKAVRALQLRARAIGARLKATPSDIDDLHTTLLDTWVQSLGRLANQNCAVGELRPHRLLGK